MPRKQPSPAAAELAADLQQATLDNDLAAVKKILQAGCKVDARLPQRPKRPDQETALMLAAGNANLPIAKLLIAPDADVNAKNIYTQPVLLYAVRSNTPAMVALLLEKGANPNARMPGRCYVLQEAVQQTKSAALTKLLLAAGASAKTHVLPWAARFGAIEAAKMLIAAGAQINNRDKPLLAAIAGHEIEMIRFLLAAGVKHHLQPEALAAAAGYGQLEVVQLLLKHGFDVNSKAYQNRTPLRCARNRKHRAVAEVLKAAGGVE